MNATLVFEGSLIIKDVLGGHPQQPSLIHVSNTPHHDDLVMIAKPHLSVLTSRDLKPLRERMLMSNKMFKEWIREQIPKLPSFPLLMIDTASYGEAKQVRTDKHSLYYKIVNHDMLIQWRSSIMDFLGIRMKDIDATRPFHISFANQTGNNCDSVANPNDRDNCFVVGWARSCVSASGPRSVKADQIKLSIDINEIKKCATYKTSDGNEYAPLYISLTQLSEVMRGNRSVCRIVCNADETDESTQALVGDGNIQISSSGSVNLSINGVKE